MTRPLAYDPQKGFMYQILCKNSGERAYEHCDYAVDRNDLKFLVNEYRLAYGNSYTFKNVLLPESYWK